MKRAIIIVDHGSTRPAANEMLSGVVELVRQRTTDSVYPAHMEIAEPTITQAFDAAVAGGAELVFVFPYFLSPGRHSREDIPWMAAEAAARHPGVRWHCCGPIGLDALMADLILHRLGECERNELHCPACPDTGVCWPEGNR